MQWQPWMAPWSNGNHGHHQLTCLLFHKGHRHLVVTKCLHFYSFVLCLSLPVCPDKEPGLQPWTPGHSEDHRVTIGYGRKVLLTSSATVHSIEILNGGNLEKCVCLFRVVRCWWLSQHALCGRHCEAFLFCSFRPFRWTIMLGTSFYL